MANNLCFHLLYAQPTCWQFLRLHPSKAFSQLFYINVPTQVRRIRLYLAAKFLHPLSYLHYKYLNKYRSYKERASWAILHQRATTTAWDNNLQEISYSPLPCRFRGMENIKARKKAPWKSDRRQFRVDH